SPAHHGRGGASEQSGVPRRDRGDRTQPARDFAPSVARLQPSHPRPPGPRRRRLRTGYHQPVAAHPMAADRAAQRPARGRAAAQARPLAGRDPPARPLRGGAVIATSDTAGRRVAARRDSAGLTGALTAPWSWLRVLLGIRRAVWVEQTRYKELGAEPLDHALSRRGSGAKEYR